MRLKETRDNWRASALLRKLQEPPLEPKYGSKKNTRDFCRGKIGTPHEFEFVKTWELFDHHYADYVCLNCGKKEYVKLQA